MISLRTQIFSSATIRCVFNSLVRSASKDPGIQQRKKIVSLDENDDETMDVEDMESDFMHIHKSHKQHVREMESMKEREKYHIVKQKYFKEKYPNFLTWHDKEQIRYLYRTNPEEWTIDRLCEGFPALPEAMLKIVKANWTKKTQNRITNHDKVVQKNWKQFKKGLLEEDLPPDLKEHLSKFSNRALNLRPFIMPLPSKNTFEIKPKITSEFSEIITSYEKLTKTNSDPQCRQIEMEGKVEATFDEKYLTPSTKLKQSITLNQLQAAVNNKLNIGQSVDENEKLIAGACIQKNVAQEAKDSFIALNNKKYEASAGLLYCKKTEKDSSHLIYPEKINIPKKLLKKGVTYKLNDCYYDDDGEFLYRVPGMSH